jgi:type VI protein secretion system component Hcp
MSYSGGIVGGYKNGRYKNCSEVFEFSYSLPGDGGLVLSVTKPADKASNMLYYRYLQCRFKDAVGKTDIKDRTIDEIRMDLCRRGDFNSDGSVSADELIAFVQYCFKGCRILSYSTAYSNNDADDDIPEETITVGFKEMYMKYNRPNDPSEFGWSFREGKAMPVANAKFPKA